QIRIFENSRVLNQKEVYQYILKRNVIKCILSLLNRQMERKNSFLQVGYFPDNLVAEMRNANAYDSFILFAQNSAIKIKSRQSNIFSESVLQNLLSKIYSTIEKAEHE